MSNPRVGHGSVLIVLFEKYSEVSTQQMYSPESTTLDGLVLASLHPGDLKITAILGPEKFTWLQYKCGRVVQKWCTESVHCGVQRCYSRAWGQSLCLRIQ